MDMLKALGLGAVLTGSVALVIGSQGSSGGYLAIHSMVMGDYRMFWSWPLFLAGSGVSWGLMALQR